LKFWSGASGRNLTDRCIVIAESFSGPIGSELPRMIGAGADTVHSFIDSPVSPVLRYLPIAPLFAIPIPDFMLRIWLLGPHAGPRLVKNMRDVLRSVPASVVAHRVRQVFQVDEQGTLRSLRKPVLYLRGLGDNLMSERSWRSIQAARPDAEIHRIRGPHMLLQVSPAECWVAIYRFLEKFAVGGLSAPVR
jgi:pimeloyl-ACP methyl ester carboxylesterase